MSACSLVFYFFFASSNMRTGTSLFLLASARSVCASEPANGFDESAIWWVVLLIVLFIACTGLLSAVIFWCVCIQRWNRRDRPPQTMVDAMSAVPRVARPTARL